MPKIAKTNHPESKTTETFANADKDSNRHVIISLIPAFLEIILNGLKVLSKRRILMIGKRMFVKTISIKDVETMKKSS